MRIIQITEQDKSELGELGHEVATSMHRFLECLDKISGGEISEEMAKRYGERRGVPGTGRYGRREEYMPPHYDERRGVPGTGHYGRREEPMPLYGERGGYDGYGERGGYGERSRYDY